MDFLCNQHPLKPVCAEGSSLPLRLIELIFEVSSVSVSRRPQLHLSAGSGRGSFITLSDFGLWFSVGAMLVVMRVSGSRIKVDFRIRNCGSLFQPNLLLSGTYTGLAVLEIRVHLESPSDVDVGRLLGGQVLALEWGSVSIGVIVPGVKVGSSAFYCGIRGCGHLDIRHRTMSSRSCRYLCPGVFPNQV